MNRKIYLSKSGISGKGIFARQTCQIGEPLFFLNGRLVSRQKMIDLGEDGDVLIQVDNREYVIPTYPALYVNHSCSPSVGIRNDFSFVALRYLRKGDEITLDYSTTMLERMWTMPCQCNSPQCRSKIVDFDLVPSSIQNRYLRLDVVQGFIKKQIAQN